MRAQIIFLVVAVGILPSAGLASSVTVVRNGRIDIDASVRHFLYEKCMEDPRTNRPDKPRWCACLTKVTGDERELDERIYGYWYWWQHTDEALRTCAVTR